MHSMQAVMPGMITRALPLKPVVELQGAQSAKGLGVYMYA